MKYKFELYLTNANEELKVFASQHIDSWIDKCQEFEERKNNNTSSNMEFLEICNIRRWIIESKFPLLTHAPDSIQQECFILRKLQLMVSMGSIYKSGEDIEQEKLFLEEIKELAVTNNELLKAIPTLLSIDFDRIKKDISQISISYAPKSINPEWDQEEQNIKFGRIQRSLLALERKSWPETIREDLESVKNQLFEKGKTIFPYSGEEIVL